MPKIGLKQAYYALISVDDPGNFVVSEPVALAKAQKIDVNPRVSGAQVPGDDIVQEDMSECLGADLNVQRDEFLPGEEGILLGRVIDNDGGVFGGSFDNAPYVAFGYRRTFKNSDLGLYVWIFKTKFSPTSKTAETKPTNGITPQYDTLSGSSITRTADGSWIYSIKSSDPNFGDTFFTKATLEKLATTGSIDAIALSSIDPVDGEIGVAVSDSVVLTFNNKIAAEAVTVMKNDGTLVAGTKSWDATGKILTIDPTVDLDATSTYIVAANGVKDIYGQTLASVSKTFTTA